ncbi:MAG: exodeoxyribonuclease III [Gemmatimonadota bacterium]
MKVATYNVNSIRARLERTLAWLAREQADVVCLQELKVTEGEFPRAEFEAAGWHLALHGQRTYNGIAILSRAPLLDVCPGLCDEVEDAEARLLSARIPFRAADGAPPPAVRVISAYVPNGKTVGSDKWAYKLRWLERLRHYLDRTARPDEPLILCGDFNVAPEDRDVARPDEWRDSVLCHEEARAALRRIVEWGLEDTIRLHHDGDGPYTWWDYRMLGFAKGNGLRIDHIFVTRSLAERCGNAYVVRDERKGKLPSDHAPVVAVFT